MRSHGCCFVFLICVPLLGLANPGTDPDQRYAATPNVLFICVDDLRPELGCYGVDYMKTPNIDRLASGGVLFTNHFAAVPTCGASRYSMLTGMLPRTRRHLSNEAIRNFISDKPESGIPETFIHHLRRNGYYTAGVGKISHYADGLLYGYDDHVTAKRELPHSWNELVFDAGKWGTGWNAFFGYADGTNRQGRSRRVKPYEAANVPDDGYVDGVTTDLAIEKMEQLRLKDRPFFLGVGFFKPHLPFNAPARYWDLYKNVQIALTRTGEIPKNVHPESLHDSEEFNSYLDGEEHPSLKDAVSDAYQRKLRHAYAAAVSYIDAQVGELLDALDRTGLSKNTIVILWSDHGWHLGEQRVWGKHTLSEVSLKSPLIVRVPGKTRGGRIDRIVSSVDIYPTLMELCGVSMNLETDGRSMVTLMEDARTAKWNDVAWSYYNRGVSLRTPRYRLTKYDRDEQPVIELFDHKNDPSETKNVAADNQRVIEKLLPVLQEKDFNIYRSE